MILTLSNLLIEWDGYFLADSLPIYTILLIAKSDDTQFF